MNRFFDNNYIGHFYEILSDFITLGYQTRHPKKLFLAWTPIELGAIGVEASHHGQIGTVEQSWFGVKILHPGNLNPNFSFTKQEIIGIVRVKRVSVQSEKAWR